MKRPWVVAGAVAVILLSFLLSRGFRQLVSNRSAIHRLSADLARTEADVAASRDKLNRLQNDPAAYDQLVRQELGYLRPGEKEVRFLKK
jgi:cell division protein FtsB